MSEGLVWSVKNGDLKEVKKVLEAEKGVINKEVSGRKPLHFAADYGQSEIVEYLIQNGADVNACDIHGISPLLAAVWEGHSECVKILLQKGASKNGKSPDGTSYLDCAEKQEIKDLLK
ncbi:hypothetical protein SNE40_001934 [Patella caerulea]|uniref:Myotrophin n=1 Tax=Patella caerulea TaxID=87958 RepID=A0AAN8PYG4_PATCE